MSRTIGRAFRFGDIMRPMVWNAAGTGPDERRWMVLVVADTYAKRPWSLMFVGPDSMAGGSGPTISTWTTLLGFEFVEGLAS